MALEQSLMRESLEDTIIMYLWKNSKTVVIGFNQNPFTECNLDVLLSDGGYLMRRTTGGGAVYHDSGNLNFSFIVPKKLYDRDKQFSVISRAVESFGLKTEVSGRNDILCEGRKFSGNAFFLGKNNNLHHGTILIKTEIEKLQKYLKVKPVKLKKHGVCSVSSRVVNLSDLADINSDNIIQPLIQAFSSVYGEKVEVCDFENLCNETVLNLSGRFSDEKFLFGKWRYFKAKQSASFDWGEVEISFDMDEVSNCIFNVEIASDCLQSEVITEAKLLMEGLDLQNIENLIRKEKKTIIKDILTLICQR